MHAAGFQVEGFGGAPGDETSMPLPGMPGVMGGPAAAQALSGLTGVGEAGGEGADIMDIHTERSMELLRQVRQFVEENPSIAAQMIKTWMRGGEEDA